MKGFLAASFAALLAGCIALPSSVLFFEVESEVQQMKKVQLQTFEFVNCLPKDKEMFVIDSLSLKPDPLSFPGPLDVSFDATVKDTINSPLRAVVYLGKKVGSTWIKIPCIGQIGSCTYDDLCQILSTIPECPPAFVSAGVPCQCPFNKGSYKLPQASFDVEAALFPPGDYHGQANLTMNGQVVGCYDIKATFA
ncbi:ganglioside GM2 activator-like [Babylonia areolata]|uniref:ganglioside GM2 activator-like n=1 Tax=Babylonia areolata TaxID=304850 RepID=UPI003FD1B435